MNTYSIKKEIKEEIPDEIYDNSDVYNEEMLMQPWKFENDIDYYETDEPNKQQFEDDDSFHRSNVYSVSDSKVSATENNIHCENVYVDGEPTIVLTNQIQNNEGASTSDPLAIPVETQSYKATKQLKKIKLVHIPPVSHLVQKTYSKRNINDPKTEQKPALKQFICSTCKNHFKSMSELQQHERICFKCKQCNLIFQDLKYLIKHMKKCQKSVMQKRRNWRSEESNRSNKKSCDICMTTFLFNEDLEEHRRKKHFVSNAYACHLCDSKFDSEDETHIHLKNAHMK